MNLLFIFGTRPEAIKLAPLIHAFKEDGSFNIKVCVTAQHREMLDQVLDFSRIVPDFDLNLMTANQSLVQLMSRAMTALEPVFDNYKPDLVFVQGDTSTVLSGALVAFHKGCRVAHIEAGLRSHNKQSPFPEEMNRLLTSGLSHLHFAPTQKAVDNLMKEGITENVFLVGNTVIDALLMGIKKTEASPGKYAAYFPEIDLNKKIILVTCHRRESFGEPFLQVCNALLQIADRYKDAEIVYPVHLNPNIKEIAESILIRNNIRLIPPLEYPYLIWLMNKSYLILTDSGGIQEEAPSLGKPVLVLRNVTERTEGIDTGNAKLVGTDTATIVNETIRLLEDKDEYKKIAALANPYGDGTASKQIVDVVKRIGISE